MPIPKITLSLKDGGLGITPKLASSVILFIGVSSAGTANTIASYSSSSKLIADYGNGPLVEAAAHCLDVAGGPVRVCRVTASTAAAAGAVTRTGTGPDPGVGLSGTPLDAYEVWVKIITGGTVGTATYQLSLDGGDNWSPVYASAASVTTFATATGLTVTFAAGTYVSGDIYKSTCTAPAYSSSDLNTALDAAIATQLSYSLIHIVGSVTAANDTDKITAFNALAAAVSTKLTSAANAYKYRRAIMELPSVADGSLTASATFNALNLPRIIPVAGDVEVISSVSARSYRRHAGWSFTARLAAIPIHEHPGFVGRGGLEGIVSLYRDEAQTPGLDDVRVSTLRTHAEYPGYYVTRGYSLAPLGSDFSSVQNCRVIDAFCSVLYKAMLPSLNKDLRINPNGTMDERDVVDIENTVRVQLEEAIIAKGHASFVNVTIDRTTNLLSSSTIPVEAICVPKGYSEAIQLTVGFANPFLA